VEQTPKKQQRQRYESRLNALKKSAAKAKERMQQRSNAGEVSSY